MRAAVRVRDLEKRYGGRAVLDGIDRHGDLYEGVLKTKQRLGSALRALGS